MIFFSCQMYAFTPSACFQVVFRHAFADEDAVIRTRTLAFALLKSRELSAEIKVSVETQAVILAQLRAVCSGDSCTAQGGM